MFVTLYIFCFCIAQILTEQCLTPNFEEAECVSLYTCPLLLSAASTQSQLSIEFVRKSRCGNDPEPMVCCGTSSNFQYNFTLSDTQYCGYQHSDDYFHPRNYTGLDEFPWLALLVYKNIADANQNVLTCSGSLINSRYVLTAAQCLLVPKLELVGVRLGEHNTKTETDCTEDSKYPECTRFEEYGIEEKIPHSRFSPKTGIHDIALVKLSSKVDYTDYIRPICLPITGIKAAKVGDTLVTSGWGRKEHNGELADIKKKILTTLLSNEECVQVYKNNRQLVTENHICTKDLRNNTEFSCSGDAGAPVMFHNRNQWHLQGISSWGKICGGSYPEVNTRVSKYLAWIVDNMK